MDEHEHDHQLERLLGRYRPAEPPPSLRARVLIRRRVHARRLPLWLSVAAALAVAAWLNLLASRAHAAIEAQLGGSERATSLNEALWRR